MKMLDGYFNDPRITGDPGLMSGLEEIQTIHAKGNNAAPHGGA